MHASIGSMQSMVIIRRQVGLLDDVDFTTVWPVRSFGPEGRPYAALKGPMSVRDMVEQRRNYPIRHVPSVHNDRLPM